MSQETGPKERLLAQCQRIPVIGELADPAVATALCLLFVLALAGIAFPEAIFPHDKAARSHVLQIAGGVIVVFGAYYASINVRDARAQQYLERLGKLIDQLGAESEAVRLGSIRLLESTVLERPVLRSDIRAPESVRAREQAVEEALEAIASEASDRCSEVSATALMTIRRELRPRRCE